MHCSHHKAFGRLKSLLAFAMAFSMASLSISPLALPVSIQAAQELGLIDSPCRTLSELASLFNQIQEGSMTLSADGSKIILQKDINVEKTFSAGPGIYFAGEKGGSYSLDLNGHSIILESQRLLVLKGEQNFTFTIMDSGGSGQIVSKAPVYEDMSQNRVLVQTGTDEDANCATLILQSGTFTSAFVAAMAHNQSRIEVEEANLISTAEGVEYCGVKLQGKASFAMHGGSISAMQCIGLNAVGSNDVYIDGGKISGYIGAMFNSAYTVSPTFEMVSGEIEGGFGGLALQQTKAKISGEAKIMAQEAIASYGSQGENKGSELEISGGEIIATKYRAVEFAMLEQDRAYQGLQDGYVAISAGSFSTQNPEQEVIDSFSEIESEKSQPFLVSGGSFSAKLNPLYLKEFNDPEQEIDQVYNRADTACPWQYCASYDQAIEAFEQAPLNIWTDKASLSNPACSITLMANAPAGAGMVHGLLGLNEYDLGEQNEGSSINLPDLTLSGYAFNGWYDQPTGGNKQSGIYVVPQGESTSTLYGQWSPDPDTPIEIPTSGKGIDEIGSQSVANVSGDSMTTYYMDENGNRAQSVTKNTAPAQAVKIRLYLRSVPEDNTLQNPVVLSLGSNQQGQPITINGNEPIDQAPEIETRLSYNNMFCYASLPLSQGSGSLSTVGLRKSGSGIEPYACTLLKNGRLIVQLFSQSPITSTNLYIAKNQKTFRDVSSALPSYGQNAVAFVSSRGLMTGMGDGLDFSPYTTLSRAQFAMIIYRVLDEFYALDQFNSEDMQLPEDVPSGLWYSKAAALCYTYGLMGQGSSFNPERALTREELALILYRLSLVSEGDESINTALLDGYADGSQVSPWAREAMAWAIENQIIGQGSDLNPLNSSSRMNTAAIMERFLKNVYEGL